MDRSSRATGDMRGGAQVDRSTRATGDMGGGAVAALSGVRGGSALTRSAFQGGAAETWESVAILVGAVTFAPEVGSSGPMCIPFWRVTFGFATLAESAYGSLCTS